MTDDKNPFAQPRAERFDALVRELYPKIRELSPHLSAVEALRAATRMAEYRLDDEPTLMPSSRSSQSVQSERARSVLLVEDEPTLSHVLSRILAEAGYDVTPCENGLAALHMVQRGTPRIDLVVSDVGLPGLRGDRLAAELRRLRPALPILLMTGYSDTVAPGNEEALGVTAVLEKPITVEVLLAAVRDALELGVAPG